jgi:beta-glucosidase/6-phospho-beta-glucosidase/beta-galactosidase
MTQHLSPDTHHPTPRSRLRRLLPHRPARLPPDFLFGTGTSDHQCEAFDPGFPDVWDGWEADHPLRHREQSCCVPRGRATDFWNRYPEDVRLARGLGCSAFRFSVAWARVEPAPGQFSEAALRHYRELVDTIVAAGMEPVVTLMHFVWPRHVEERGGLRAADFPAWFGAYVARVRDALGDRVRYWITINEPNALLFGYLKPFWLDAYAWPPGLPAGSDDDESMRATAEVIRNLFQANRAARLALRDGPQGERRLVSANSYYLGLPNRLWRLPIPLMKLVDEHARSEQGWSEEDWVTREGRIVLNPRLAARAPGPAPPWLRLVQRVSGMYASAKVFATLFSFVGANWWQLGLRGDLPEFLCPRECRGQLDYVAFDYYFGTPLLHHVGRLMDVLERRYHRAPIWAGGLYDALTYFQGMFPRLPLFVIENGVCGQAMSPKRARYFRNHIREVQRAREAGVNVIGYLAWSLTTNHEWGLPHGPDADFGLYHVNLGTDPRLIRRPTPAAVAFRAIVQRHRA